MKIRLLALVAGLFACAPGVAQAQDKILDVRAEARLGYETPTVSDNGQVYKIGSAVSYGGELGVDLHTGKKLTVGPYVTYEKSGVSLCDGPDCLNVDSNLGISGRVAYKLSSKAAIYGKLGYADLKFSASTSFGTGTDHANGAQGAIGATIDLQRHVYVMVEVNYADYGKFYGINLQRRHVATGIGIRF